MIGAYRRTISRDIEHGDAAIQRVAAAVANDHDIAGAVCGEIADTVGLVVIGVDG